MPPHTCIHTWGNVLPRAVGDRAFLVCSPLPGVLTPSWLYLWALHPGLRRPGHHPGPPHIHQPLYPPTRRTGNTSSFREKLIWALARCTVICRAARGIMGHVRNKHGHVGAGHARAANSVTKLCTGEVVG